jgi:hypothetical protein
MIDDEHLVLIRERPRECEFVDPNLEGGVSETLPAEYRSPVEAA